MENETKTTDELANKNMACNLLLGEVITWLEANKQSHNYCEDTWYSCPKHEEGCANDGWGKDCNCGADDHNAEIDALCNKIRKHFA